MDSRKERLMTVVRTTRLVVAPENADELLARRASLIAAVRAAHPGLVETRLARVDERTFVDTWRWDSAASLHCALDAVFDIPEAGPAFALTETTTLDVEQADVVDER
jgi:quinol monooxygenase YgiN